MPDKNKIISRRIPINIRNVWVYLAVAAVLNGLFAGIFPKSIANNDFLQSFLPHEYLETLIVLVTITLASIVNIHVKLTIMMEGGDLQSLEERQVAGLRRKTNDVARFLLVITLAALLVLILDGTLPPASLNRAWTFCGLLALLLGAIAATYEVQRIVMSLSELPDRG